MSHELKTSLNHIISQQSELLNYINELPGSFESKLKKCLGISHYLLSLLRDMIDYVYIKSDNFAFKGS